ncbi:MAG: hypothetical protein IJ846_08080 [Alphaproteobacteria bacterium]|nr:hypothetical protein [Alphaproteobacteria bacterium]
MKMTVGNQEFEIALAQNETAKAFSEMLPLTVTMSDLHENEKYVYLDNRLPSAPENVGKISAGDVMLFGDNCLVVFYKSFQTSYSYTKIGRIIENTALGTLSEVDSVMAVFTNGD